MGGCASEPEPANAKNQTDTNRKINHDISAERQNLENEYKLLLLGAGESGKSTIAKQVRLLYQKPFEKDELNSYRNIVYSNTISSMRILVEASHNFEIPLRPDSRDKSDKLLSQEDSYFENIDEEVGEIIKTLWNDPGIQETFTRSSEFQLNDSAAYFFENIDRLSAEDYEPSDQDVIRSRAKTTGIIETDFTVEGKRFRLVDVGGQRSERKKWMHCFQDVTAVLFCVAMSEYNLQLYEDDSMSRMHESMKVFKEICANKYFVDTTMVLFLNKKDLFVKKIEKIDLKVCFPEYTGGHDFEGAANYMRTKFEELNDNPKKQIYSHITCATDRDQIHHVFAAVRHTVLQCAFHESGLT